MYRYVCLFLTALFIAAGCATSEPTDEQPADPEPTEQPADAVDEQLAKFDEQFRSLDTDAPPLGEGDGEQTERRLAHMQQRDQFWRQRIQQVQDLPMSDDEHDELAERIADRTEEVDVEHADELKAYLDDNPWPCRETIGPVADDAAFLLVQHADHDSDFQRRVLEELEKLADEQRTDTENFALLYDRVAVNQDEPQRYGTQGDCTEDGWKMNDVEDPDKLDERRAELNLMPMESYRQLVEQMCEQMPD